MVNVGKYTIHGWYGIWKETVPESKGVIIYDTNPNNLHNFSGQIQSYDAFKQSS